jgi:isoleucyl-tRNA synthetase
VWTEEKKSPDKYAFYASLYRVLSRFAAVLAPFCPFLAESVWSRLGYSESVHLSDWPEVDTARISEKRSLEVAFVRRIISAGLALRSKAGIRVRQPLKKLRLANLSGMNIEEYFEPIREELNVKEIELLSNPQEIGQRVGKANSKKIGPKYGPRVKEIFAALKSGDFQETQDGRIQVDDLVLEPDEASIAYIGKEGADVEAIAGAVIALDLNMSPELEREGYARDLVRQIQELRKEADFQIADRIRIALQGGEDIVLAHEESILRETLARERCPSIENPEIQGEISLGEHRVLIQLSRIPSSGD